MSLTIALTAVLALDQRGLRPAEDRTLRGAVSLAGHDTINYTIAHEPQPSLGLCPRGRVREPMPGRSRLESAHGQCRDIRQKRTFAGDTQ